MPYADVDGGRLFYAVKAASSDAPVLVLVHGAGGSRLHWPPQLRRLMDATVYTLDLPGHGRSEDFGSETIEDYARVVDIFLGSVVAKPAVIIGHSMGGAIAQALALGEAELCDSLVLIGTGARLRVAPSILRLIESDFDQAIALVTKYAWYANSEATLKDLGKNALKETGADVLLRDFRACDRFDVMDRIEDVDRRTLVVVGADDRLTPAKYSRYLAERLPHARLVTVENAGHMVMMEKPDKVANAILRFLIRDGYH